MKAALVRKAKKVDDNSGAATLSRSTVRIIRAVRFAHKELVIAKKEKVTISLQHVVFVLSVVSYL